MSHTTVNDSMTYEVSQLISTRSFLLIGAHSAVCKLNTWMMGFKLLALSIAVGAFVVLTVTDHAEVKASKFEDIVKFLQLFVALMLGFFLSSSVTRWYTCVDGFMQLFDSIRNMQMQFYALGASQERTYTCIRYGVLSAVILSKELQVRLMPKAIRSKMLDDMWNELTSPLTPELALGEYRMITRSERELLKRVEDGSGDPSLSGCMWMWVGSLVGRMAQDGEIPPMSTPTYGRIMNLAMAAHAGIRQVKATVCVQAPFAYSHTLALLVHINNICSALAFGITLGLTYGTLKARYSKSLTFSAKAADYVPVSKADIYRDTEELLVNFICGILGPIIYQIILDVCVCIAMPFDNAEAMIPTEKLLASLEKDLFDAVTMAENPVRWNPPFYKAMKPPSKH